jgi:hypothetical protein
MPFFLFLVGLFSLSKRHPIVTDAIEPVGECSLERYGNEPDHEVNYDDLSRFSGSAEGRQKDARLFGKLFLWRGANANRAPRAEVLDRAFEYRADMRLRTASSGIAGRLEGPAAARRRRGQPIAWTGRFEPTCGLTLFPR